MKYSIMAIMVAAFFMACQKDKTFTTESGLKVNFITDVEGDSLANGDILLLNMKYIKPDGKVMFDSKDNDFPTAIMYNPDQWKESGLFYEALAECNKGDSISFAISAFELFQKTFKSPVPDSIDGNTLLKFNLGVENVMDMQAFQAYRTELTTGKEKGTIDEYLSENNLDAQVTESGLRYIITKEADGPKPEAGDQVVVHYRGAFLDDREFDSSYERGPFEFTLGQGRVIKGWDEGIALLNTGSKATFIIPSALGYGERGAGGSIPPNTILKFDVELLEIK